MSGEAEERLTEWAVWFHANKKRVPKNDLMKQNLFLLKAMDGCFEVMALALKDIQELERRHPLKQLWLPKGVEMSGDMTKFG